MKFHLACGDVMPGCPTSFTEDSEEALLSAVATHASREHGVHEITPEVREAVASRIRRVD